jgi:hypothetical protein
MTEDASNALATALSFGVTAGMVVIDMPVLSVRWPTTSGAYAALFSELLLELFFSDAVSLLQGV